jgi:hypothetical protein
VLSPLFLLGSLVFEQEFRGFIQESAGFGLSDGVLLLELGGFLLAADGPCRRAPGSSCRPLFSCCKFSFYSRNLAGSSRKWAGSGSKRGCASRQSRRSSTRAGDYKNSLAKALTGGRRGATLGSGNQSPTLCRIMISPAFFTTNRACCTMRRRHLQEDAVWQK